MGLETEEKISDNGKIDAAQIALKALRVVLFVLFAAAAFYLMEAYEHNAFTQVRPLAQLFNILLFELVAWVLYLLTGGMRIAMRVLLVIAAAYGLVNHYVMQFRSTPLVPWDIFSVKTAASVASGYDFTPSARTVLVTLGFVALIALAEVLRHPPKPKFIVRLPAAAIAAVALCLLVVNLQDEDFQTSMYLYPYLFTPVYMTQVNGMAVTFAMNLQYLAVEKPKGYDADEAAALLAEYDDSEEIDGSDYDYPNIIVIMDEAFSDLSVLGELDTNEDYMPFVHSLEEGTENTVTGYAQVSVCGGNTANSEFEFLTGNTMAFLPTGSIAYQQYIKNEMDSLPNWLEELGYDTYAQHPYASTGWDRDRVYPLLGFTNLNFIDDYQNKAYVRNYVSDACDMKHIIKTYENRDKSKPFFLFNVTMQNHGGYTDTYDNLTNTITAGLGSDVLDQYLTLLSLTDEALEELISYFSQVDDDTMIIFFGDHQPNDSVVRKVWTSNGVDSSALTEGQERERYLVPYIIWANFDIDEATGQDTSLNFLAAQALELAGVPTSAYENFLLDLNDYYSVISAAGETIDDSVSSDDEATADELLDEYKILQYYQLFE